jgi:RNA polymerase sigma factor (sigma-70 family)
MSDLSNASTTIPRLKECLDRLSQGDDRARDDLVTLACQRLQRLAKRMMLDFSRLGRWEEADDVFQNSMVRLCRALEQRHPATVREFFGLASLQIRRELIDLARHYFGPEGPAARHHTPGFKDAADAEGGPPPAGVEVGGSTNDPRKLAEWTEFHRQIEQLPAHEREVVELLWYHELTQEDAATVLNVDVRTVRRRWQSARFGLHARLGGEPPPDQA